MLFHMQRISVGCAIAHVHPFINANRYSRTHLTPHAGTHVPPSQLLTRARLLRAGFCAGGSSGHRATSSTTPAWAQGVVLAPTPASPPVGTYATTTITTPRYADGRCDQRCTQVFWRGFCRLVVILIRAPLPSWPCLCVDSYFLFRSFGSTAPLSSSRFYHVIH